LTGEAQEWIPPAETRPAEVNKNWRRFIGSDRKGMATETRRHGEKAKPYSRKLARRELRGLDRF